MTAQQTVKRRYLRIFAKTSNIGVLEIARLICDIAHAIN
jgi:hypothetical protein